MSTRCADRRAVERAIELTVFAPVGLLALASERLPGLVERGRRDVHERLTVARLVGQMTVQLGRAQVQRRLTADTGGVAPAQAPTAGAESAAVPDDDTDVDASNLPIDDYESLAASQVVARLATLDPHELDLVEKFERATRNRRTVLGRIAQLRAPV